MHPFLEQLGIKKSSCASPSISHSMAILLRRRAAPRHRGQSEAPGLGACQGLPKLASREQRGPQTPPQAGLGNCSAVLTLSRGSSGSTVQHGPPQLPFVLITHPSLFKVCYGTGGRSECRKRGTTPGRAPGELPLQPQLAARGPAIKAYTH